MDRKEPKPLQELHKIRSEMAEELKGITKKGRCAAINNEALTFLESKGLAKLIEKHKKAA